MIHFCKIHFTILSFLTLLLSGCAGTATEIATETAKNQVIALEKSLTADCKTASVNAQLGAIKTQIASIEATCQAEQKTLRAEKAKWQVLFFSLLGLFLGLTFLKKRM